MIEFTRSKRVYSADDPFYDEGNISREIWAKHAALEPDLLPSDVNDDAPKFFCNISGCTSSFKNTFEFESHYNSVHRNVCKVCKRVFPSNRILELHILEAHDAMFKAMAERQKMYECLVEGCPKRFWNDHVRKLHLVDLHKYPKDFKFHYHKQKKGKQTNSNKNSVKKPTLTATDESSDCGMDIVLLDMQNVNMSDIGEETTEHNTKSKQHPKDKAKNKTTHKPKNNNNPKTEIHKSNSNVDNSNRDPSIGTSGNSPTINGDSDMMKAENTENIIANTENIPSTNNETDTSPSTSKFKYSYSLKTKNFSFGGRGRGRR